MKAVVFGPPCGGKTTIANALADRFVGTKLLSMRGMCLREVAHDTFDGRTWWNYEQKRLPLPIGLTNRIVGKHLRATPSFVIDGFPKTSEELEFFLDTVGPPTHLFVVQAQFGEIAARARGRFECSDCLTTFPSDIVECPRCHGRLRPRPEDAPDVLEKRFQEYRAWEAATLPLLRHAAMAAYEGSSNELLETIHNMTFCDSAS